MKFWQCTDEGQDLTKNGSHEARLLSWLPKEGATVDQIKAQFKAANVALGAALKNKVIFLFNSFILELYHSL